MHKSFIKILSVLLIVGLNWTGLSAVIETFAYMNDTETSSGNTFTAATLDFSLDSPNDFFPTSPGEPNQLLRDISVIKEGSLGFEYKTRTSDVVSSGPGDLCNKLLLAADLPGGDIECPAMDLANFSCSSFELFDPQDDWQFVVIPTESHLFSQTCEFKLIFEGWQPELDFSSGFSDVEEIDNTVYGGHFDFGLGGVVINEFLPDPIGSDDGSELDGEWVELYNRRFSSRDVSGWKIYNSIGQYVTISNANTHTGDTNIDRGEFLVIYLNGAMLDNTADTVYLKREIKIWIWTIWVTADNYSYNEADGDIILENKSFARIPDGSLNWYDPIPTPGGPNKLEKIIEEETIEEETPLAEETQMTEEETVTEEIPTDEEILASEEKTITEGTEEEIAIEGTTEEITETSGETTEDIIEEVAEETTEEIVADETVEEVVEGTVEESVSEAEAPIIEDVPIIEEAPADEIPAVDEQPATVPDDSSSTQGGAGENSSDGGSGDGGGGDTSGSLDSSGPAEGASEGSSETGDSVSE